MSQPGRVQSKHLFNLQLTGEYNEEVAAELAKTMQAGDSIMAKAAEVLQIEDDGTAIATWMRPMCEQMFEPMAKIPYFIQQIEACHQEQLTVPATDFNSAEVRVLVHRPKRLQGASPAIIYIHGGGVVGGTAAQFTPHVSNMAESCGVVVFNVDYRLAPEAKCPENIKDCYSVLKYVLERADTLGVDPARVAILGESGGGHLTAALSLMLVQRDEAHLVKLAMPIIPMLDDYCFTDPRAMTREEAAMPQMQQKVWNAIATDLAGQRASGDPLLFPAKTPDSLLAKFPPTVILESEFDFYITEATRFAARLRAAGRLLEFVVIPGIGHGHAMEPRFKKFHEQTTVMKKILKEYLID